MKTRLIELALIGLACTANAAAQERSGDADARDRGKGETRAALPDLSPDRPFRRHADVIGLELLAGVAAGTADSDEEPVALGEIDDLVVDGRTGRISHVVVASGDALRVVRWKRLEWDVQDDGTIVVTARMSAGVFRSYPKLAKKDADAIVGRRTVDAAADRAKADDARKAADRGADGAATEATVAAPRSHLVTDLVGREVLARGSRAPVAMVSDLVIDRVAGRVAFSTIELDDRSYLVPIEKLAFRPTKRDSASEPELRAFLDAAKEALDGAPMVDGKTKQTAQNPRFRDLVYRFHRVENPDAQRKPN